jgi:hypothetical protein
VASRRKRKRERRRAEATAKAPGTRGGWGQGAPTTKANLLLVRQAIRENWPMPDDVRRAIIEELFQEVDTDSSDVRRFLAIMRVILAMVKANIDASS